MIKSSSSNPPHASLVILTSQLDDIFISHYDVGEILQLGQMASSTVGSYVPPSIIRGALWAESCLSNFGVRYWIKKSPLAGLANLNCYHETTELLRSIPQVTIAAIVSCKVYHLGERLCVLTCLPT